MTVLLCNADPDWPFVDLARRRLIHLWPERAVAIWDLTAVPQPGDALWPDLPRVVSPEGFPLALAGFIAAAGLEPVQLLIHLGGRGTKMVELNDCAVSVARALGAEQRLSVVFVQRAVDHAAEPPANAHVAMLVDRPGTGGNDSPDQAHRLDLLGLAALLLRANALIDPRFPANQFTLSAEPDHEQPWMAGWHDQLGRIRHGVELHRHGASPTELLEGPLAPLKRAMESLLHWTCKAPPPPERTERFAEPGTWLSRLRVRWWRHRRLPGDFVERAAALWPKLVMIDRDERQRDAPARRLALADRRLRVKAAVREVEATTPIRPPTVAAVEAIRTLAADCRRAAWAAAPREPSAESGAALWNSFGRIVRRTVRAGLWWPRLLPPVLGVALVAVAPAFMVVTTAALVFVPGDGAIASTFGRLTTAGAVFRGTVPLLVALPVAMGAGGAAGLMLFLHRRRRTVTNALGRSTVRFTELASWFQERLVTDTQAGWRAIDRHGLDLVERLLIREADLRHRDIALAARLPVDSSAAGSRQPTRDRPLVDPLGRPPGRWLPDAAATMIEDLSGEHAVVVRDHRWPIIRSVTLDVPVKYRDVEIGFLG